MEQKGLYIKKAKKRKIAPSNTVYLGNLPKGFDNEECLLKYFSQYGSISDLRIPRSAKTGNKMGYMYMKFDYPGVAKIVQKAIHGHLMFNRILKCRIIKETVNTFKEIDTEKDYKRKRLQKNEQIMLSLDRSDKFEIKRMKKLTDKVKHLQNSFGSSDNELLKNQLTGLNNRTKQLKKKRKLLEEE